MNYKHCKGVFIILILISMLIISPFASICGQGDGWAETMIKAFRSLKVRPNDETADLLYSAAELMPKKDWEVYLLAATLYAPGGNSDAAFLSIEKALAAGLKDSALFQSLSELSSLHDDPRWEIIIQNMEALKLEHIGSIRNPELFKELEIMWGQDQSALAEYGKKIKSMGDSVKREDHIRFFKPVEVVWEANTRKLRDVIDRHGWLGYSLVGEDGAELSWSIAQHAPDVFFKEQCLKLISEALKNEDVDPNHYAELHDRIARDTWRKQRYGASMAENAPYPIEDPANVDSRRADLGLFEPIEVYSLYHGIGYQRTSEEEAKFEQQISYKKAQDLYEEFINAIEKGDNKASNSRILEAIEFHGDISNEQLYKAATSLAQTGDDQSERISLNILKVLIWRKWANRFTISKNKELAPLHDLGDWQTVMDLLKKSG